MVYVTAKSSAPDQVIAMMERNHIILLAPSEVNERAARSGVPGTRPHVPRVPVRALPVRRAALRYHPIARIGPATLLGNINYVSGIRRPCSDTRH